jgi:rubrerythrin
LDVDRRRFLNLAGMGAATGAAAVLAGCGNEENKGEGPIAGEKPQGSGAGSIESDVNDLNVLNGALDLEHEAVAAYSQALKVLRGANLRYARTILDQERAHVAALQRTLRRMGVRPNEARSDYNFPRLTSEDAVLRFATQLENKVISNYVDAVPRLDKPELRAAVASILADDAEHLAVINGQLKERSAPSAFVTGEAQA